MITAALTHKLRTDVLDMYEDTSSFHLRFQLHYAGMPRRALNFVSDWAFSYTMTTQSGIRCSAKRLENHGALEVV